MAIWQFPIELVPSQWVETNDFNIELLYGEEGYDTTLAWENYQPNNNYKQIFTDILPVTDSWDKELELWGDTKVHDISVWFDEGKIFSIGFRLDLREQIRELVNKIISAAEKLDCYFFVPGQKIIFKPDFISFIQYARQSNAAKFVNDPMKCLDEVAEKHNK
ncbi:hypothetical protein [uncultured Pseudoteredinibacter sp.]|uniref:hypothetical protein n=1 Tax=uncultured Pseudoteredinibacter sp. TaxID=1641701 RepID=UPI002633E389|nr:hypothetical protein [uncultured Pseudoteredinibacter sp.]